MISRRCRMFAVDFAKFFEGECIWLFTNYNLQLCTNYISAHFYIIKILFKNLKQDLHCAIFILLFIFCSDILFYVL